MKSISKMKSKKLTGLLFLIYLIVLSWIILFKMHFDMSLFKNMNFRNINLVPFAASAVVNGKVHVSEIILNVIAFIPFGIYLSMLKQDWSFLKKVMSILVGSLLYEILQYIFAIGGSDITDLIGNTLGGIIGIGLFFICNKIFKGKTLSVLNLIATIGTVIFIFFLGLLAIVNL